VLVDNVGALTAEFERDLAGMNLLDDLARVYADGPEVGIQLVVGADRSGSVPRNWAALTQQKLLFRLAEAGEYAAFDVPRQRVPAFVPGRAVAAATSQVVQLSFPGKDLAAAVAQVTQGWPGAVGTARAVRVLPARITLAELAVPAHTSGYPWRLPIGIDDDTLAPAALTLYEHEHAVIAGPARSGRSTALLAIARALATSDLPPTLLGVAGRRSPLHDCLWLRAVYTDPEELTTAVEALGGPVVLLVDDADQVADRSGELDRLVERQRPGLHVIAAGRADNLRRAYGHWTQRVRESRCGVLLVPDADLDGDLLSVDLPRLGRLAPLPGRGYLVCDGTMAGIQLALPDHADSTTADPTIQERV
jgi:S-DNA-T family DNA segregation ATPase FtsK/SpoIIIE